MLCVRGARKPCAPPNRPAARTLSELAIPWAFNAEKAAGPRNSAHFRLEQSWPQHLAFVHILASQDAIGAFISVTSISVVATIWPVATLNVTGGPLKTLQSHSFRTAPGWLSCLFKSLSDIVRLSAPAMSKAEQGVRGPWPDKGTKNP